MKLTLAKEVLVAKKTTDRRGTAFQRARATLERLVHSRAADVARQAHDALAAAYHWEDSGETTGDVCRLLADVTSELQHRDAHAR